MASSPATVPPLLRPQGASAMSFWEPYPRGLVIVAMVNETVHEIGEDLVLPVGIHVTNLADVPVVGLPGGSRPHEPASLPRAARPAVHNPGGDPRGGHDPGGGLCDLFVWRTIPERAPAWPTWWCAEEKRFAKADVRFHIGGETLPFALRPHVGNPFCGGWDGYAQVAMWADRRTLPAIVAGEGPLWTQTTGEPGRRVHGTIDATNLAVWTLDHASAANANVTRGIEDDVPAGWTVEEGTYSVPPDEVIVREDGTQTPRRFVDLPAAQVDDQGASDLRCPTSRSSGSITLSPRGRRRGPWNSLGPAPT